MKPHAPPARPASTPRHARTILAAEVLARLHHLGVDLDRSISDLLAEGALLVCRYYDQGEGLPEPMPPREPGGAER